LVTREEIENIKTVDDARTLIERDPVAFMFAVWDMEAAEGSTDDGDDDPPVPPAPSRARAPLTIGRTEASNEFHSAYIRADERKRAKHGKSMWQRRCAASTGDPPPDALIDLEIHPCITVNERGDTADVVSLTYANGETDLVVVRPGTDDAADFWEAMFKATASAA
jgi:hypothetical protein